MTPRQWQIAELVAEGMTNFEVAKVIGKTHWTVRNALRTIFDETGMSNRTELALWIVAHKERKQHETENRVRGLDSSVLC